VRRHAVAEEVEVTGDRRVDALHGLPVSTSMEYSRCAPVEISVR
jgi:hypothetical protein